MTDVHSVDAHGDLAPNRPEGEGMTQLFREEALNEYQRGRSDEGHLLEIEPVWMSRAYGVILALLVAALLFSALVFALLPALRGPGE